MLLPDPSPTLGVALYRLKRNDADDGLPATLIIFLVAVAARPSIPRVNRPAIGALPQLVFGGIAFIATPTEVRTPAIDRPATRTAPYGPVSHWVSTRGFPSTVSLAQ